MALLPALAVGMLGTTPAAIVEPASPAGRWLTGPDGGVVEIAPCGADAFCGRIIGIAQEHRGAAMPVDTKGRRQCGLTIITEATKTGKDQWSGEILDPRTGKTYHVQLSVDAEGRLHVHGYVGLAIFGETVTWTKFQGRIGADCRITGPELREAGPIGG
jgi:uncharacterized protein (DUF2147 family)